jgi:LysR family glycine cleavage system transcriptional activator
MTWRLPPLNALRAFEAAGRHVSFTRAAEELRVTPGAVSRQIKLLEDFLGVALFERGNRELRISPAGQAYAAALNDIFERMHSATGRVLDAHRERSLNVHCAMTFTLRWLMPRLPQFHKLYPKREIRLTTALAPVPAHLLNTGDFDVTIQLGRGDWDGLVAHRLAGGELVPVCSPALLKAGAITKPNDLARHVLLHSLARPDDWRDWLVAGGADKVDPARGLRFESSSLAYQAAIDGMGVAIGQMALVIDDLEAGRLIPAFDFVFQTGNAYYITYVERAARHPQLVEFRDWIVAEAARFEQQHRFPHSASSIAPDRASPAISSAE